MEVYIIQHNYYDLTECNWANEIKISNTLEGAQRIANIWKGNIMGVEKELVKEWLLDCCKWYNIETKETFSQEGANEIYSIKLTFDSQNDEHNDFYTDIVAHKSMNNEIIKSIQKTIKEVGYDMYHIIADEIKIFKQNVNE